MKPRYASVNRESMESAKLLELEGVEYTAPSSKGSSSSSLLATGAEGKRGKLVVELAVQLAIKLAGTLTTQADYSN